MTMQLDRAEAEQLARAGAAALPDGRRGRARGFELLRPAEANAARCPRTFAAVSGAPLCRITARAFDSILAPQGRRANRAASRHDVPPGCGFRLGNEVRQWEEGTLMIFDDTIEHAAWNDRRAAGARLNRPDRLNVALM